LTGVDQLDGSTLCVFKGCGRPAKFRWMVKNVKYGGPVQHMDFCQQCFDRTIEHNVKRNFDIIDKKIKKFTEEFGINEKHELELRQHIIDKLLADRKNEKTDYAIIFKYCVSCGKEKAFHCALISGFYSGTVYLMKKGWICGECSSDGSERFGDRLLLLTLAKNIDLNLVKK